tara:strand:- start:248 stop:628 length:381 start_codon:yes stop_codon:yes gene_type:complete
MELNSSTQDNMILIENELQSIKKNKIPKPQNLSDFSDEIEETSNNPFLDRSVRSLIDEFVLTWHKILIELLDISKYETFRRDEWWNYLYDLMKFLKKIFWVEDRLFHIGFGLIIISFFVFFIMVTK